MNGPPPRVAAATAYRRLLADQIAGAVQAGCSVALIGGPETDDVLDLEAVALAGANIRVLALRPPWDSASFIRQFATEWRASGLDADLSAALVSLPKASGERFAMLLHQAHLIPPETFRHLERLAQAWPGMQMVFAGSPAIADLVRANQHHTLAQRVSRVIEMTTADEARPLQQASEAPSLADAGLPPIKPTMIVDAYPPIHLPKRATAARPQAPGSAGQMSVAQAPLPRNALRRVVTWSLASLVGVAILTTTAVPRLPRSGQSIVAPTQIALRGPDPAPAPVRIPAEPANRAVRAPIAEPKPVARPDSPVAVPSAQNAAPDATSNAAPPAAEPPAPAAKAPATDPVQEAASAPARPDVPTRPDVAARADTEDLPTPPARSSASSLAAPSPSPAMADAMTRRGVAMLEIGDVSAARLLLARAASAGSGVAALAMGTTYDAATLERIGAVGIVPDPVVAAAWYRFALALGEDRAQAMLEAPTVDIVTNKPKDTP